jgi:hypothetical protein
MSGRRASTSRRVAALIVVAAAVAGCGVQPDAAPRDLPEEERTIAVDVGPSGSDASGANRIFLVAPGEERLLRSVPREASTRPELIGVLLAGPNHDELDRSVQLVHPESTELISARTQGQVLTIKLLSCGIARSGQNLARSRPDRVHRHRELDGIEDVRLRVDGDHLAPTVARLVAACASTGGHAEPAYPVDRRSTRSGEEDATSS